MVTSASRTIDAKKRGRIDRACADVVSTISGCVAVYKALCSIIQRGIEQKVVEDELDSITLAALSSVHGLAVLHTAGVDLGIASKADLVTRARQLTQRVIRGFRKKGN